jgi:hypothetical protein
MSAKISIITDRLKLRAPLFKDPKGESAWENTPETCVISGFRHEADENCALLGCYAVSSGKFLPTFRDNLFVPAALTMVPIGCHNDI